MLSSLDNTSRTCIRDDNCGTRYLFSEIPGKQSNEKQYVKNHDDSPKSWSMHFLHLFQTDEGCRIFYDYQDYQDPSMKLVGYIITNHDH